MATVAAAATMMALPAAAGAAPAQADAPPSTPLERVQALVQPAVVYEQITWSGFVYDKHNKQYFDDSKPLTVSFQCTGFVVNPDGYVGTAGHCVDFDQTVREAFFKQTIDYAFSHDYYVGSPSKATIATFADHWRVDGQERNGKPDLKVAVAYGVSVSGEPSGKAMPARLVKLRPFGQGDVALLEIKAENLTVLPLSDNDNTGVGTQIVAVGYPSSVDLVTDNNFNPSFKEGSISAEKTTQSGLLPVYEISAAVSGGMSGGPTANLDGQVIGVNSFGISGETQSFNFVQPAETLQELMRGEGVDNSLGQVTDLYRAGLAAYFTGDRDAAIAAFDQVLQIVPNHEFAQEYKSKAQALPVSSGLLSSPLVRFGLPLLVLVIIVVGVLIFVLARRGRGTAEPAPAGGAPQGAAPPGWGPPAATPPGAAGAAPVTAEAAGLTAPIQPVSPPAESAPPSPPAAEPTSGQEPSVVAARAAAGGGPAAQQPSSPAEAQEAEPDEDLFCPNCGRRHAPDARFCSHCGQDLTQG